MVNVTKRTVRAAERSYEWSPTEGVTWGLITNIGAKIASVAAAWPGVSAGICLQSVVPTAIFDTITNETFSQREQNEKLVVPPRTKVNAVITTYAVRHELHYTVEFGFPAWSGLSIKYETPLQRCFSGVCSTSGYLTASDILRGLSNYREANDWVYFTQDGKLSWTGESSKVMKTEEPLK